MKRVNTDKLFREKTDDFYCDFVFSGKIKVRKVKETDNLLAFYHTRPSYKFHVVIVPKKHVVKLSGAKKHGLNYCKEAFDLI